VSGDALRYKQVVFGAGLAGDVVIERAKVNHQLPGRLELQENDPQEHFR